MTSFEHKGVKYEARMGSIVDAQTEVIVNAANSRLAGGGGVDGAIHRAAGPELYSLTSVFSGCPTGSAVITGAGKMQSPIKFIIHAVGPVYDSSDEEASARLLASAYASAIRLALENDVTSIAVPSLSTGAFGYPIERAAPVAVATIIAELDKSPMASLRHVVFFLFSQSDYEVYARQLENRFSQA